MGFFNKAATCYDCRNFDKRNIDKYGEAHCYGWGGYAKASKIADSCKKFDPWFIVTSTCQILGFDDNCDVAIETKKLKDIYMLNNENGLLFLEDYNKYGKEVSEYLNNDKEKEKIAKVILANCLAPVIKNINNNNYEEAFNIYQNMFYGLMEHYNIEMVEEKENSKPMQRVRANNEKN